MIVNVLISISCLLSIALIYICFISHKSQKIMHDFLELITKPENLKIQNASRILQSLLKDEVLKIENNFKAMIVSLKEHIVSTEQMKQQLTIENDRLVTLADNAHQKITDVTKQLETVLSGLGAIVTSQEWKEIQNITDSFCTYTNNLLDRISDTTSNTSDKAIKIQEQITNCIQQESQMSNQLSASFNTNADNIAVITNNINNLQQQLIDLNTNVINGFNNVNTASSEYDTTMKQNDKLLNDYLIKLSDFTKRANKELFKQQNMFSSTANVVGTRIRLAESSIKKQLEILKTAITVFASSSESTEISVQCITKELTDLNNKYHKEIEDFSKEIVVNLQNISGVANTTLENTKVAATEFANSVKNMGVGVKETLIEMNKAHIQLSGQSENLIKMSTETTEQLKPLSELIEKYYQALPDLTNGSKDMGEQLQQLVSNMVDNLHTIKTTIAESLSNIDISSTKLNDVAGQSRQHMIDLMSDYAKAVDTMQTLNKQMQIARVSAPMEAINNITTTSSNYISPEEFIRNLDNLFIGLYEQTIDLTKSIDPDIPQVVWDKYNKGNKQIFAKWLSKILSATDKKQIHKLFKTDNVFNSQATQFIHNFEKILFEAKQTNNVDKVLKTDLGNIYTILKK